MTVVSIRKRRIKRPRRRMPSFRRKIRAKSLFPKRTVVIHKGKVSIYKIRKPLPRIFIRFRAPIHFIRRFINFTRDMAKIERIWKKPQSKTWKPKKKTYPIHWGRKKTTWGVRKKWDTFKKAPRKAIRDTKFKPYIKKETKFEPYIKIPRFGKKGFLYDWRGGARDMSGRKYENYGPYPKELGPHLIFDIIPTRALLAAISNAQARGRNIDRMKNIIKEAIDDVRKKLIVYTKKVIKIYVPIETGELQESMIDSIEKSKRMGYRLKVELSAEVDWAGVANKMPEKKIKHFGNKIGRRSGKPLYDPKAQKGSYWLILMLLKGKSKELIKDMITGLTRTMATRSTSLAHRRPTIGGGTMTEEERRDTREVRWRQWQTRIYEEGEPTIFNYPKDLIKGWFKIKGLYKYR